MLTYSREFLEHFDRRFQSVQGLADERFILAAREWIAWLESDPRTRLALDALRAESEQARSKLDQIVQEALPKFVALRARLSDLPGAGDPSDEASEGGSPTPFETGYSFRAFDLEVEQLNAERPPRLNAQTSWTDPLSKVLSILEQRMAVEAGKTSRVEALILQSELRAARNEYRQRAERVGWAFFVSPGRNLRILTEQLGLKTLLYDVDRRSWFEGGTHFSPDASTNSDELAQALRLVGASGFGMKEGATISKWTAHLQRFVAELQAGVRERVQERLLLLSALERFKQRCELHDLQRLRKLADEKGGSKNRSSETRLTMELARYLFDLGFNPFTEVNRGDSRADLLLHDRLYVEAKQVSEGDGRSKVIKAYWQARDGAALFHAPASGQGIKTLVVAVFILDGPGLDVPQVVRGEGGAPDAHLFTIDLRDASQKGSRARKAPVPLTDSDFRHQPEWSATKPRGRAHGLGRRRLSPGEPTGG